MFPLRGLCLTLILCAVVAAAAPATAHADAVDISYTPNLLFVGDKSGAGIDVVDLTKLETVFRIKTEFQADHIIAAPEAPLLVYTNIKLRKVVFYHLAKKEVLSSLVLSFDPRSMVLDTTGTRIAVSDPIKGGFALIAAFSRSVEFTLEDFPPTADMLFDPNETDIYYSNLRDNALGLLDTNTQKTYEVALTPDVQAQAKPAALPEALPAAFASVLTAPSRSLDGRYVYVANTATGEGYAMNAFSKQIYRTFALGESPARPYTTPGGVFLYFMDETSGRLLSIEQNRFTTFADVNLGSGVDLVVVGRFDRMSLFVSSQNRDYAVYDNLAKKVVARGKLKGTPLDAQGSVDGKKAYLTFTDIGEVAEMDLESQKLTYVSATASGASASAVGLSNNVCH